MTKSPIWRRLLAAATCGAAAALALAPLYLWPLMAVGYSGLLWLLSGSAGWRPAFALGWAFGVGYFLVGLHWVGYAFMVDAARFAWMMPFALFALAAGLGLFPGLAAALTRRFSRPGLGRLIAFTLFWGLSEWLRGAILTGFPWLLSGHVWAASEPSLQPAAYLGVSGLGLLAVWAAAAPALTPAAPHGQRGIAVSANVAALAVVVALLLISHIRLQGAEVSEHAGIRLRLVQAGIPQAEKWRPELRDRHLALYLRLSLVPDGLGQPPDFSHLIWPETATPFFLADDPARRGAIARALPSNTVLITGTPRRGERPGEDMILHNSIVALAGDGAVTTVYDKVHLVPFGEYLPWRGLLTRLGLDKLAVGVVDFSPGPGSKVAVLPNLPPFRPLICYEIIFPREISASGAGLASEWLLNVTNDAWFGDSFGPVQHLDIARIRAAELGLPVVRAANTGISAIIDPYGRIIHQLPLNRAGVIDGGLPMALPKTLYARFGDGIFALLCLLLGGLLILTNFHGSEPLRPVA
jgi:apolipoprotein N-acyltransferase